jgi:hypothetical protein
MIMTDISKQTFEDVINVGYRDHMDWLLREGGVTYVNGNYYFASKDDPFSKTKHSYIDLLTHVILNKLLIDLGKVASLNKKLI